MRWTFSRARPRRRLRPVALVALGLLGLVPTACGSLPFDRLPRAAEPAGAPALAQRPIGTVTRLGAPAEGVVADPVTGIVAVALRDPDALALVDGDTGRVRRRVALPGAPRHLALSAPGGPVLAPSEGADELAQVALPGGGTTLTPVGRQPHDATAAGGRIFVGDERGNTVSVVTDGQVERTVPVAAQPGGLAAVADGSRVGVVSVRERVLELLDARSLKQVGRATAGVGPTHVVAEADRLYVTDTAGDALLVFRTRPSLDLTRRMYLPGSPYGIAVDPEHHRLWITVTARNALLEYRSGSRPGLVASYPTVRQANSVAVDPTTGTVWVAGAAEGELQRITDADREAFRTRRP